MEGKSVVEDLDHALKCVRGLYYQDKIFEESNGKQGKRVEFHALSDEDQKAVSYLRNKDSDLPADIKIFIARITSTTSYS